MSKRPRVLCVDIGGVLVVTDTDGVTDLIDGRMDLVPQGIETLRRLSKEYFGDQIYFVSKCGAKMQMKTRRFLVEHKVFEHIGIPGDHLVFCFHRSDKAVAAKELGATHFIDDRLEILGSLKGVEHRFLFSPKEGEVRRHEQYLPLVRRVSGWDETLQYVAGTTRSGV